MLEQEKKEKNLKLWRIAVTVLMLLTAMLSTMVMARTAERIFLIISFSS